MLSESPAQGHLSLDAQVSGLLRDLDGARAVLDRQIAAEPAVHRRLGGRLEVEIDKRRRELLHLQDRLARGGDPGGGWRDLRAIQDESRLVLLECLAVAQGISARHSGLDGGLCAVADALLDDLSDRAVIPWRRTTVLADSDFTGFAAQIIRLRYPASIWSLPIVVHEFGHFIGPEIRSDVREGRYRGQENPVRLALRAEYRRRGDKEGAHLDEEFADVFATYAAGPAYPCAAMLLRFDHRDPADDYYHPSEVVRAHLMLSTLRRMDAALDGLERSPSIVAALEKAWRESLESGDRRAGMGRDQRGRLAERLDQLYGILEEHLGRLRCGSLLQAAVLKSRGKDEGQVGGPADGVGRYVLNAAGLARSEARADEEAVARLQARALDACHQVVRR